MQMDVHPFPQSLLRSEEGETRETMFILSSKEGISKDNSTKRLRNGDQVESKKGGVGRRKGRATEG